MGTLNSLEHGATPDGQTGRGARAGRTASRHRRSLRWALAVGYLGALVLAAGVVGWTSLPSVSNAPALAEGVISENHGLPTPYPPPVRVSRSLVAIEDHAFGAPPLLDIGYGVARWSWGHLQGGGAQGGSTLAQQLAKRIYTGNGSSVLVKLEQVGIAAKLEIRFPKTKIMQMYLDAAYFGDGSWGVEQASLRYFGKRAGAIDWQQAALLAGLVQSPTGYDPLRHPHAALIRRNEVLAQLAEIGAISHGRSRVLQATGLGLKAT